MDDDDCEERQPSTSLDDAGCGDKESEAPRPKQSSLSTHSRRPSVVTSGKLKRRKSTPKNIFTTSFTKNIKSNNSNLARQVAMLREQLHRVCMEIQAVTHERMEERMQISTEKVYLGEHVSRFEGHIKQCVDQVSGFITQLGNMDAELKVIKEYCKETIGNARPYRDDNNRDEYNRASGGSKTQTVNPMVSGLTITQPTISLSRVDNPAAALRPSSAARVEGSSSAARAESSSRAARVEGSSSAARAESSSRAARVEGSSSAARVEGSSSAARVEGSSSAARVEGSSSAARVEGGSSAARAEGGFSAARAKGSSSAARVEGSSSAKRTMARISEEHTLRASEVGPAERYEEDSDDEVDNSMLSRSNRVWTDPRAAGRNACETETQAAFHRRVLSEDPLEGTSRSHAQHRRMPQRIRRADVEPVSDVHNRTSLDAVDMDETDISDLSPILRCPAATLTPAVTLTHAATSPVTSQHNALIPCSVNMSVGNALDKVKLATSRVGKSDDVSNNAAPMTTFPMSPVDRLRLTVAQNMSRPSLSLIPCTVNLTATDTFSSTYTTIASGSAVSSHLSASSACPLVSSAALSSNGRKKGRHSVISTGKAIVGSVRTPNATDTNTSPIVSRNRVKLHSPVINTAKRSGNVASATKHSPMPSDKPLETLGDDSSGEDFSNSTPPRTKTVPVSAKLPEKSPASPRAPPHPDTDPRSGKKLLKTEPSSTPVRAKRVQVKQASKSALEQRRRSVSVPNPSQSDPVKKTARHQHKKTAAAAHLDVENDMGVLYEETPTLPANTSKSSTFGRRNKQLKGEPMSDSDVNNGNNEDANGRRALRRVGPTNYKEPSLHKKMRREYNCESL